MSDQEDAAQELREGRDRTGKFVEGNPFAFQEGHDPRRNEGGRPKGHDPGAVLRRKWAERLNEHGEGAGAVEIAQRIEDFLKGNFDDPKAATVQLKALQIALDRAVGPVNKTPPPIAAESLRIILAERPEAVLPGSEDDEG